jgi:hypothetical protein
MSSKLCLPVNSLCNCLYYLLCLLKTMLEHGISYPQHVVYCTLLLGRHPSTHNSSSCTSESREYIRQCSSLLPTNLLLSAVGLSADFTWINPLGFLALTIWSFGIYFSPIAREEYRLRHEGNNPQVSKSDLAFALHGFILSSAQFIMVYYYTYFYRRTKTPIFSINQSSGEEDPLLPEREDPDLAITSQPTTPSLIFKFLIALAWVAAIGGGAFAKIGNFTFLDWLYLISTIKLIISIIKFIPQVLLNWRLKSSEGFSVAMPVLVCPSLSHMSYTNMAGPHRWCPITATAGHLICLYRSRPLGNHRKSSETRSINPVNSIRSHLPGSETIPLSRRKRPGIRG